jgi:hypothetical protein
MKTILKLIVTAVIANAGWHVADAWLRYYKFRDAVTQAAQFGGTLSEDQMRTRVMELASQYSVPLGDDNLSIRRDSQQEQHTYIDASYQEQIELFPRMPYPWTFPIHTDTFTTGPGSRPTR